MSDEAQSPASIEDLSDLYENAPVGYLSVSADGRIAKVNATLCRWLGVSADAVLQKRLHDLLTFGCRLAYETQLVPLLRLQGHFEEVALDFVTSSGAALPVLANATDKISADGELLFTRLAIFRAVERRRYERRLVDARAATQEHLRAEHETAELREQFIAVLGHDLRNPLAAISGASRLLRRESLSDKGQNFLALMDGSVMRMAGLIDNVMDFARGRLGGGIALAAQPVELEPVLEQVVDEFRSSSPERLIETEFLLDEPVECDRSRIAQMVSNLLGNAITHGSPSRPVRLAAAANGSSLEITVSNAGEPISAAAMERLFQPFFRGEVRSSLQGLGLGLHIASEIAKAHAGTLTVASSSEETRFTFNMPLTKPPT